MPSAPATILLAAGASTRLGRPKQLVEFQGEALLRRTAALALEIGASPIVAVLGFRAESCRDALSGLPITIAENTDYISGMGATLRLGLRAALSEGREPERLLLLVCDQPLLTAGGLKRLIEAPGAIAAAQYNDRLGVPAVFARKHFAALAALTGDQGARSLLRALPVTAVPMPEAAFDLDTPADLAALQAY